MTDTTVLPFAPALTAAQSRHPAPAPNVRAAGAVLNACGAWFVALAALIGCLWAGSWLLLAMLEQLGDWLVQLRGGWPLLDR